MDDGFYKNLNLNNENLADCKDAQEIESAVLDYYDNFLYNRDGFGMDNDTSYDTYVSGVMKNGVFYCSEMTIEVEYLDEMNETVSHTVYVDFATGDVSITDDDLGIIHHDINSDFELFDTDLYQ